MTKVATARCEDQDDPLTGLCTIERLSGYIRVPGLETRPTSGSGG
jgi:hypothetical protein